MYAKRTSKALVIILALVISVQLAVPAFGIGGTTAAQTPRAADEARLKWDYRLKETDDWGTNVSDPVLVGSNVFVAMNDKLLKLAADGTLAGQANLAGLIDYTCRPLALDGVIYVPLGEGRLQAVNAATLQSVWVTAALPGVECGYTDYDAEWNPITVTADLPQQSQTTVAADGGKLYFGTACADWVASYFGTFLCVDAATGNTVWTYENDGAGYYWSGAAFYGNAVIFAGDDGILTSLNKATGAVIDTLDLGAAVRSTVVVEGAYAFAAARDGKFNKVALNAGGGFGAKTSVTFAADSTSTPAIANGKAYVGGAKADYTGVLAVIEIAGMTASAVAVSAPVQASPLVSTAYGTPYVYYTANGEPGALYVYNGTAGAALFTPAAADRNYCVASVVAGSDGTLYYTNDSGKLFAVEKIPEETSARTWLDKLPGWLGFIRNWSAGVQNVVYYLFFGWIWDVIYK